MQATQTARPPQDATPPSFETVWAILDRVSKKQEELTESQKETDRIVKETTASLKETERVMKENSAEFNRRLGSYINLFGGVTESMIAPKLREKFAEFGLDFPKANPNASVEDRVNKIFLEIDIMLENGDKAMLVEVKTKLTIERIKAHITRLEKMRAYADLRGDKRTFLGAVAGIVIADKARDYALNQGFYLIEPSGESFNITPPQGKPKEW
jgi:5-methylcytosine-specific restriction endonuclease McrBC regulatory subunit McrC